MEAIERVLITAIYTARRELVITSPYFVPSEALQMALASAALRGVRTIVIVPDKVDSILVRWASAAFIGDMLATAFNLPVSKVDYYTLRVLPSMERSASSVR